MSDTNIYTVGGTIRAERLYISRKADEELLNLCRAGAFAYVLTPRQMGKSSLMVRTAQRLEAEGVRCVQIDLSGIGTQVTAEQWYLGLLAIIEEELSLETDVLAWWQAHAHLGITQRLSQFFQEVLLAEVTAPIVIFVDEIDTTLTLPFTDDFYAAIRYFYNARAHAPELGRLTFVLIGVATPGDLIRDPQRTPFNVGQRVDLTDFTFEEALPLADGLGLPPDDARQVLRWVLKWTGGHPYLTQWLCHAAVERGQNHWSEAAVDHLVANTFFGEKSQEDNHLQFVRDMLTKRAPDLNGVLTTYREIRRDRRPVPDEEQSLVKSHLKISGIVRRENGALRVRNPIYGTVFDERWIKEHLPVNYARLAVRALTVLIMGVLIISTILLPYALVQKNQAEKALDAEKDALVDKEKALKAEKRQRRIAEAALNQLKETMKELQEFAKKRTEETKQEAEKRKKAEAAVKQLQNTLKRIQTIQTEPEKPAKPPSSSSSGKKKAKAAKPSFPPSSEDTSKKADKPSSEPKDYEQSQKPLEKKE